MIVYFLSRDMSILGQASSNLPSGIKMIDDKTTQDVETGIKSLSCVFLYNSELMAKAQECIVPGNYLLIHNDDEDDAFFTIMEAEDDTDKMEINCFSEDAGLDLLGSTVPKFPDAEMGDSTDPSFAANIEWYFNKWLVYTGFTIGINEIGTTTTKHLEASESTLSKRLLDIAELFDAHISYRFIISGFSVINKYIDIKKNAENLEKVIYLYKGDHWDNLVIKKDATEVATALQVIGKEENGFITTLDGLTYDDGDFYIAARPDYPSTASHKAILYSRTAKQKWGRYTSWPSETGGDIIKVFRFDTNDQNKLLQESIKELTKLREMETTYEVEILRLPEDVSIGDYVYMMDRDNRFYLKARLIKTEKSNYNDDFTCTFDNWTLTRF